MISRCFFETSVPWPSGFKSSILRLFGARIGDRVVIKPRVKVKYPWFLRTGDDCWIGEHCWIDNLGQVNLGNDVVLSQGTYLLTGNHDYKSRTFDLIVSPIEIEDGAWIGAKATVCPGVKIGRMSLLSVGSVASTNLEEFTIYRGNPAQEIRERRIETE